MRAKSFPLILVPLPYVIDDGQPYMLCSKEYPKPVAWAMGDSRREPHLETRYRLGIAFGFKTTQEHSALQLPSGKVHLAWDQTFREIYAFTCIDCTDATIPDAWRQTSLEDFVHQQMMRASYQVPEDIRPEAEEFLERHIEAALRLMNEPALV